MPHVTSKRLLIAELVILFGFFPLALSLIKPHGWMYVTMWLVVALCLRTLYTKYAYGFMADWNSAALTRSAVVPVFKRFVPLALALLVFTWVAIPEHLFSLPKDRPQVWLMVMILYPVLSVLPQELIYRSYFFRRYGDWLGQKGLIIASALSFGWMHILLQNWVAVSFSVVGGVLFADTYRKSRSLAVCCFEHALYGCYIFTIGLGYYFYHGQAVR